MSIRPTWILAVAAVALVVSTTAAVRGVDDEEAAIRATIQHYFDGGMELREAFWPDARMLYMREGELQVVPIQDYIARAEARADEPPPADVSKKILSIDRFGDAAVAKNGALGRQQYLSRSASLKPKDRSSCLSLPSFLPL